MGLLDASYSAVNTKKPRKSDRILPATELNARGLLDAATNVPIAGDALSGVIAAYDAAKGDYGSAAMNALGVLPFVSGTFIGKGAKTWDKVKEADAMSRLAKGEDAAKVWKETGYGKAPWDKAARSEIDDSKARLRDYFYTPQEAYKNAAERALINDSGRDQVRAMIPYKDKSVSQLKDEYKRTGGEIVDAAMSGNKELAMQLSENRSGLDGLLSAMRDRKYGPMSNYMAHGDLGQAYPDVYKMHTRIDSDLGGANGKYLRGSDTQGEQIVIGQKPQWKEDKSVALHELQHAIQQREGWAKGGSPEMFNQQKTAELARDALSFRRELLKKRESMPNADWMNVENAVVEDYYKIGAPDWLPSREARDLARQPNVLFPDKYPNSEEGFNDLTELVKVYGLDKNVTPYSNNDMYKRLAGEAEARLTQARMNLSPEQRLAQYPYDPEYFKQATGVDINNLIVRGDGGTAMSLLDDVRPMTEYEKRHEIARQNAVKMLGLPENNTAMDRARAMGYTNVNGDEFYGGMHRPPMSDSGAPAHDLTGGGNVYPDDVYSPMASRYYGSGDSSDGALFRKLQALKGKPEEKVRVFRAVPSEVMEKQGNLIHHGDWVTPNRDYAVMHGEGALNGDYRIQAQDYPAKALFTNGDSAYEFGVDKSQLFADGPASIPVMISNQHNVADRSRFAAFDPAKKHESDMLGYADPRLLGLIGGGGLLGLGAYKANQE